MTRRRMEMAGSRFTTAVILTALLSLNAPAVAQPQPTSTLKKKTPVKSSSSGRATSPSGTTSSSSCPLVSGKTENATKTTSGLLCQEDALGQWFPLGSARLMLRDLKAGRAALALQPKLEARIGLADKTEQLLKQQIETEEKISAEWERVAKVQTERLRDKDAWYRSSTLWFAVGVVTAVGIGFGAAKLYAETR